MCANPMFMNTYIFASHPVCSDALRRTSRRSVCLPPSPHRKHDYRLKWELRNQRSKTVGNLNTHEQLVRPIVEAPATAASTCPGNYLPSHRGCSPPKTVLTPQHRPQLEVLRVLTRTYTIYAILSYRRLLQQPVYLETFVLNTRPPPPH